MARKTIILLSLIAVCVVAIAASQSAFTRFGGAICPVQYFNVAATDAGPNVVVAAPGSGRVLIIAAEIVPTDGSCACFLRSGDTDLAGSADAQIPIDGHHTLQPSTFGWFVGSPQQPISLHLAAEETVVCYGTYVVVP